MMGLRLCHMTFQGGPKCYTLRHPLTMLWGHIKYHAHSPETALQPLRTPLTNLFLLANSRNLPFLLLYVVRPYYWEYT